MKNQRYLIFALLIVSIGSTVKGSNLSAGISTINISPPLSMKFALGGYGERMNKPAEGIHDSIWAKALTLKSGNRKYALITLDLLMLPDNVKSDLIKRVPKMGWNMGNIMLLPSHSHGSLEMNGLNSENHLNNPNLGIFQPELLEFLIEKLATLLKEADKNYQPVRMGTGCKVVEGLSQNRRKDPEIEKELIVTRVDLENGKPLAVLVNWTAHPTFLDGPDMLLSAEWPGYLQTNLEQMIGNGVTAMYYNGSEGDQAPLLEGTQKGYEKIETYGKKIADHAVKLFKEIESKEGTEFNYNFKTIKLPKHSAHPSFMKTGGEEYGLTEKTIKIAMDMLGPKRVVIGAVRLGDLIISGAPGEMSAVLGQHIKKTLKTDGIKYVAIGGLANQWISYILSKDQYLYGEGYESSMSFYGPNLGAVISDEAIKTAQPLIKNDKN
jgi:neutral ceramidase